MSTQASNWKLFWLIGIITMLVGMNVYIYSNVYTEAKKETSEIQNPILKKQVNCSPDSCSFHPKWLKNYEEGERPKKVKAEKTHTKAKEGNPKASMLVTTARSKADIWAQDTSSQSEFKRKIVKKAKKDIRKLNREKGEIYCRLAIDRQGNVVACKYIKERSTIEKEQLGQAIAAYLKQFKFEEKPNGPELEYTGYSVTFK